MTKLRKFRLVAVSFLGLSLAACATTQPAGQDPGIEVTDLTTLPAPRTSQTFQLLPQQAIEITVVGAEEISGKYLIDERGMIEFPLIGQVQATGMGMNALAQEIARRLDGQYVIDPQVRVVPVGDLVPTISVGGEVAAAGTLPANTSFSLLRAINNAGGFSKYAKRDDVLIMRTVDGQRYVGIYNFKEIARGNLPDPAIFPGDIVMVGDSPFRRRFDDILGYVGALSASVILIDRVNGGN